MRECFPHCPAGSRFDAGSLAPLGRWAIGRTPEGDAAGSTIEVAPAQIAPTQEAGFTIGGKAILWLFVGAGLYMALYK
jgi:hypothetical protein